MLHRTAVALLESLEIQLTACLDEAERQGARFDSSAWIALRDLCDSDAFESAFLRLDERAEDKLLARRLYDLIDAVVEAVQSDADMSDADVMLRDEERERVACPLFAGMEVGV